MPRASFCFVSVCFDDMPLSSCQHCPRLRYIQVKNDLKRNEILLIVIFLKKSLKTSVLLSEWKKF